MPTHGRPARATPLTLSLLVQPGSPWSTGCRAPADSPYGGEMSPPSADLRVEPMHLRERPPAELAALFAGGWPAFIDADEVAARYLPAVRRRPVRARRRSPRGPDRDSALRWTIQGRRTATSDRKVPIPVDADRGLRHLDPRRRHRLRPVAANPSANGRAQLLGTSVNSQAFAGTIQQWQEWSGLDLPGNGAYVVTNALAPL